jgi:hypothetical protein
MKRRVVTVLLDIMFIFPTRGDSMWPPVMMKFGIQATGNGLPGKEYPFDGKEHVMRTW